MSDLRAPLLPQADTQPKKKPRIDAFDSLRFVLIAYIATGHFIAVCTSNPLILRAVTQINVVVGGFFVLSGYVAAYTTTELGERKGSKRLDNVVEFAVTRIMGFWPLHMLVIAIFGPMFFWVDATYSGVKTALWHGFLSAGLLQAWFPLSGEIWNAPTWFLSAFAFALVVLPYALRVLALQSKVELRRTLLFLTAVSAVSKISYSYDLRAWNIMEGMLSAKTHPNYALFNAVRFSPFAAVLEVLMGAAACRLVMLDEDKEPGLTGSAFVPLLGMLAVMALRTAGIIAINDLLVRSLVFIPLWIMFLMRIHRESVGGTPQLLPKLLCQPVLQYLGKISFPIFIVHGPIGQLFFKKAVAKQVWGRMLAEPLPNSIHPFFAVFWLTVLVAAALAQKYFIENNAVKKASNSLGAALQKALGG